MEDSEHGCCREMEVEKGVERDPRTRNICKNQPRSMIKFINMQTALCAECKSKNMMVRCNEEHLGAVHGVMVDSVYEIVDRVKELMKEESSKRGKQKQCRRIELAREEIMSLVDGEIQRNIEKVKMFLNKHTPI